MGGDANLVNGAQMGTMCFRFRFRLNLLGKVKWGAMAIWLTGPRWEPCVVQARWRQPLACPALPGNHCPAWQESIYLYCPLASFEVSTAMAVAQVLFRATKCHGGGDRVYRAAI